MSEFEPYKIITLVWVEDNFSHKTRVFKIYMNRDTSPYVDNSFQEKRLKSKNDLSRIYLLQGAKPQITIPSSVFYSLMHF